MSAQLIFIGGKGGVGKTTVSSAVGLAAAQAGAKTLLVSTDPAHSTSDVFGQSFRAEPTAVTGVEGLDAIEIDPEAESERHMNEIRHQLAEQVSPGIVNELKRHLELAHQTPGAYEAALFDRFIDIMDAHGPEYDRIVFDTAPTGSTLRLLTLPELLEEWIDRLIDKRTKSIDRYEKAAIGDQTPTRSLEGDPIIAQLEARRDRFQFAKRKLRDEAAFYLVLNPDQLSVNETDRAVTELQQFDLTVDGLIVNKLTPKPDPDETGTGAAYLMARRDTEAERLEEIETELAPPIVARITARPHDIDATVLEDLATAVPSTVPTDAVEP